MRLYWESYGCSANQADMERILGVFRAAGFSTVDTPRDADIIVLNTCAVKLTTENRMISRYKSLARYEKPIIVTGCLPKMNLDRCVKECPNFAALLDPNSISALHDVIKRIMSGERGIVKFSKPNTDAFAIQKIDLHSVIEIVPISFGCLGNCAFCGVKNVRGRLVSVPITSIRSSFEQALSKGKKEFWITSQDDAIYGWDIGLTLNDLLASLLEVSGEYRIRIGMMNPGGVKKLMPEILDIYQDPRIYKFVHIPVQSGSDKVLRLMRRQHTVSDFIDLVNAFRDRFPDMTISTDIIVGFPGETEEDFQMTLDLLSEVKPDIINVSKFYPRPNTEAARMKKVPTTVISERSREISRLVENLARESNQRMVGRIERVLVSDVREGQVVARTSNYKQIFIPNLGEDALGKFFDVKVVSAGPRSLRGELV